MIEVRSARLALVAATPATLAAERDDLDGLGRMLDAAVPQWPPPLNDDVSHGYWSDLLRLGLARVGWVAWYFVRAERGLPRVVIGNGGFKGAADAGGAVEIGYALFPQFERCGYATEAVGALVGWAFAQPGVRAVIAETESELERSQAVLARSGFVAVEPASEPGLRRFRLDKVRLAK